MQKRIDSKRLKVTPNLPHDLAHPFRNWRHVLFHPDRSKTRSAGQRLATINFVRIRRPLCVS
jgi:hypothetical protein